ncbi:MAG TPA: 16S rRNA (guanine(527)-N(7))-methyltransferase RsmG [Solirubrobacteraceae bacterium]|jgi:16S rRNA (guanine527-N7)-methyltransferase|nr:16S rRNA (guanine(527)-N(7))-methyltransferase RsmG [Solirubrobacteraceae bacterium]
MNARTQRRLAQLADRFALPAAAPPALAVLLEILATDAEAPTTIVDPSAAVDAHVADALVALELEQVRGAMRIADLGSGAGFPGLVLAAALPAAEVALVESSAKKCAFLGRAAEAMGLSNVDALPLRAEEWSAGLGRCDLVTARAVASLSVLVEYAAPLLAPGGALVAWKGRRDAAEEADGDAAAAETGLAAAVVRPVRPWEGAENLHLHLYMKVGATPNRYPRRVGTASKRPLRASA